MKHGKNELWSDEVVGWIAWKLGENNAGLGGSFESGGTRMRRGYEVYTHSSKTEKESDGLCGWIYRSMAGIKEEI